MGAGCCRGTSAHGQPAQALISGGASSSTATAPAIETNTLEDRIEHIAGHPNASALDHRGERCGQGIVSPISSTAKPTVAVTTVQAAGARKLVGGTNLRKPPLAPNTHMRNRSGAAAFDQQGSMARKVGADMAEKTLRREVQPSSGKNSFCRLYSVRSEEALHQLGEIEGRLVFIENRVLEIAALVRNGIDASSLTKVKTELAFLEAEANKLESKGVDNVYTSELNSGKIPAKETKKEQLRRLEALFVQIEDVFQRISSETKGLPALTEPLAPDLAS